MKVLTIEPVAMRSRYDLVETKQGRWDRVADAVSPAAAEMEDEAHVSAPVGLLAVEVDGSAVRWEKIARLREQIAAGTYHVPSLEVAGRMMDAMMR
jgi:anti-sigma28 factor (negative regulator of flagellin synthesis)